MISIMKISVLGLNLLPYLLQAPRVNSVPVVAIAYDYSRRQTNAVDKKIGLGWPNGDNADITQFETAKVGWYYTWSPWPVPNATIEFVPMLRGPQNVPEFSGQVNPSTVVAKGIRHVLGMNEPQEASQGLLAPRDGANMWKALLEPLKGVSPPVRLGSPAVSNGPSGKLWLQDWFAACEGGCTADFVTVHWYGLNASDFIAHVADFYYTFQRPIWVTEWAAHNFGDPALGQFSQEQINEFLAVTQAWLDSTGYVERYAWFGAMVDIGNVNPANRLMSPQGTITDLGKQYIGIQPPPVHTSSATIPASTGMWPTVSLTVELISTLPPGETSITGGVVTPATAPSTLSPSASAAAIAQVNAGYSHLNTYSMFSLGFVGISVILMLII